VSSLPLSSAHCSSCLQVPSLCALPACLFCLPGHALLACLFSLLLFAFYGWVRRWIYPVSVQAVSNQNGAFISAICSCVFPGRGSRLVMPCSLVYAPVCISGRWAQPDSESCMMCSTHRVDITIRVEAGGLAQCC
jgi:hypothetical protein